MRAKVKYRNGWILEIPSTGIAALLLLEWVSEFRKMPIEKVINSYTLQIRFNLPKEEVEDCAEYINAYL